MQQRALDESRAHIPADVVEAIVSLSDYLGVHPAKAARLALNNGLVSVADMSTSWELKVIAQRVSHRYLAEALDDPEVHYMHWIMLG